MTDTVARLEAAWLEGLLHRWGPPKIEFYDQPLRVDRGPCVRTGWCWFPGNVNNGLHIDRHSSTLVVVTLWNHKGNPGHIEVTFRSEPTEDQLAGLVALMWGRDE